MRKVAISLAVAALVMMTGCNEKKSEEASKGTTPTQKSVEQSAPVTAPSAAASKTAEEPAVSTEAKMEAVTKVEEKAQKAAETVIQKSEAITQSVKEETTKAKEALSAATEAPKTATASVDAAQLFVKCAGCHGSKGEKHALGQSNIIAGQAKADLIKKIEGYKDGTYGGAMKGVMKGQVGSLTPEQIDALAGYISTLK